MKRAMSVQRMIFLGTSMRWSSKKRKTKCKKNSKKTHFLPFPNSRRLIKRHQYAKSYLSKKKTASQKMNPDIERKKKVANDFLKRSKSKLKIGSNSEFIFDNYKSKISNEIKKHRKIGFGARLPLYLKSKKENCRKFNSAISNNINFPAHQFSKSKNIKTEILSSQDNNLLSLLKTLKKRKTRSSMVPSMQTHKSMMVAYSRISNHDLNFDEDQSLKPKMPAQKKTRSRSVFNNHFFKKNKRLCMSSENNKIERISHINSKIKSKNLENSIQQFKVTVNGGNDGEKKSLIQKRTKRREGKMIKTKINICRGYSGFEDLNFRSRIMKEQNSIDETELIWDRKDKLKVAFQQFFEIYRILERSQKSWACLNIKKFEKIKKKKKEFPKRMGWSILRKKGLVKKKRNTMFSWLNINETFVKKIDDVMKDIDQRLINQFRQPATLESSILKRKLNQQMQTKQKIQLLKNFEFNMDNPDWGDQLHVLNKFFRVFWLNENFEIMKRRLIIKYFSNVVYKPERSFDFAIKGHIFLFKEIVLSRREKMQESYDMPKFFRIRNRLHKVVKSGIGFSLVSMKIFIQDLDATPGQNEGEQSFWRDYINKKSLQVSKSQEIESKLIEKKYSEDVLLTPLQYIFGFVKIGVQILKVKEEVKTVPDIRILKNSNFSQPKSNISPPQMPDELKNLLFCEMMSKSPKDYLKINKILLDSLSQDDLLQRKNINFLLTKKRRKNYRKQKKKMNLIQSISTTKKISKKLMFHRKVRLEKKAKKKAKKTEEMGVRAKSKELRPLTLKDSKSKYWLNAFNRICHEKRCWHLNQKHFDGQMKEIKKSFLKQKEYFRSSHKIMEYVTKIRGKTVRIQLNSAKTRKEMYIPFMGRTFKWDSKIEQINQNIRIGRPNLEKELEVIKEAVLKHFSKQFRCQNDYFSCFNKMKSVFRYTEYKSQPQKYKIKNLGLRMIVNGVVKSRAPTLTVETEKFKYKRKITHYLRAMSKNLEKNNKNNPIISQKIKAIRSAFRSSKSQIRKEFMFVFYLNKFEKFKILVRIKIFTSQKGLNNWFVIILTSFQRKFWEVRMILDFETSQSLIDERQDRTQFSRLACVRDLKKKFKSKLKNVTQTKVMNRMNKNKWSRLFLKNYRDKKVKIDKKKVKKERRIARKGNMKKRLGFLIRNSQDLSEQLDNLKELIRKNGMKEKRSKGMESFINLRRRLKLAIKLNKSSKKKGQELQFVPPKLTKGKSLFKQKLESCLDQKPKVIIADQIHKMSIEFFQNILKCLSLEKNINNNNISFNRREIILPERGLLRYVTPNLHHPSEFLKTEITHQKLIAKLICRFETTFCIVTLFKEINVHKYEFQIYFPETSKNFTAKLSQLETMPLRGFLHKYFKVENLKKTQTTNESLNSMNESNFDKIRSISPLYNDLRPSIQSLQLLRKKIGLKKKFGRSLLIRVNMLFLVVLELIYKRVISVHNNYFLLEVYLDSPSKDVTITMHYGLEENVAIYLLIFNLTTNEKIHLKFKLRNIIRNFFKELLVEDTLAYGNLLRIAKFIIKRITKRIQGLFVNRKSFQKKIRSKNQSNRLFKFLTQSSALEEFSNNSFDFPKFISRFVICHRKRILCDIFFEEKNLLKVLVRYLRQNRNEYYYFELSSFCCLNYMFVVHDVAGLNNLAKRVLYVIKKKVL